VATITKGRIRAGQKASTAKPWTVRYWADGRQRERSFRTRREAESFKVETEHKINEGTYVDPRDSKISFGEYAEQWIKNRDMAPGSKRTYLSALRQPALDGIRDKSLAQVANDREGVIQLLADYREAGKGAARTFGVIKGTLDEAVNAGRIAGHRLGGIAPKVSSQKEADIIPLTREQLDTLTSELGEMGITAWIQRGCGLRPAEALAVGRDWFRDTDNGMVLRVSGQVSRSNKENIVPLKSRQQNEIRDVPAPNWLWAKVQAHAEKYNTGNGRLVNFSYNAYQPVFQRAAKAAGLPPGFTPHQLRHHFASVLLAYPDPVPITDVSKWLGHRNTAITSSTYAHLLPESYSRARDKLETL